MKKVLLDYIVKNKKNFMIILILFFIGLAVGILFVNNSSEIQKTEITNYIQELIKNIKESENVNKLNLLCLSIKQNTLFILLIWFLGCTIIGGLLIYVTIIYKGIAIGYTISSMIAVLGFNKGIKIALISLLLQNIIFLPSFFIIAESRN